jgi:hypothetical protein
MIGGVTPGSHVTSQLQSGLQHQILLSTPIRKISIIVMKSNKQDDKIPASILRAPMRKYYLKGYQYDNSILNNSCFCCLSFTSQYKVYYGHIATFL